MDQKWDQEAKPLRYLVKFQIQTLEFKPAFCPWLPLRPKERKKEKCHLLRSKTEEFCTPHLTLTLPDLMKLKTLFSVVKKKAASRVRATPKKPKL